MFSSHHSVVTHGDCKLLFGLLVLGLVLFSNVPIGLDWTDPVRNISQSRIRTQLTIQTLLLLTYRNLFYKRNK